MAAWGFDEGARGELETMLPYISALHRAALAALLGVAPVLVNEGSPAAPHAATGLLSPLDPSRKLAPLDDIDELVQTITFVLENEDEIDDFERALDAVVRLGPQLQSESERFSPVFKRFKKMRRGEHAIDCALADALEAAFNGVVRTADHGPNTSDADLDRRLADLTQFMAQQSGLPALSSPTHKRGFIDPLMLVERIAAHALRGYGDTGPDGALAARFNWSSRKWHDELDSHAIKLTLPAVPDLPDHRFIAMRRHCGWHTYGNRYFSAGEGNLLYAAAIFPGSLESFFSYGAYEIGSNIDWSEAN